ncbi:MAG: HAD hydrolase family protein [Candidatus Gastranaerophilales bacterium]|nr:HAD hydrolase family protein [Candidatus Gastranaerophilales bacterium]
MIKLPDTITTIITDFDGILTDNFVYINENSLSTRKMNYKDITGCFMLKQNGYQICIISGERNPAIEWIKNTFELNDVHQRIREKLPVLKSIIEKYQLTQDEYVYIGDDINDIDCLEYAKYKITVPNATKKVKELKNIQITECSGGDGAFREVADCLTDI